MINLLRRTFIKNYQDINDEKVRVGHGKMASIFGIVTNAILFLGKLTVAILLAQKNSWIFSAALIGDSINNLGDLASSVVSLIGFSLAGKPADEKHPFGHERIEYIAGLIISVLVIVSAAELLTNSIQKITSSSEINYDNLTIIVLSISIALKLYQGYFNYKVGKIINSPSLKATFVDSATDAFVSSVLLIGIIVSITTTYPYLDGYLGLVVSVFVAISGIRMIKETSDPLIGTTVDSKYKEEIESIVKKYPQVLGVHDLIVHFYGPTKIFLSFHAEIDEHMRLVEAHDLIDEIEKEVEATLHANVTIHIDPISTSNYLVNLKQEILKLLQEKHPNVSIHDFRVNPNKVIEFDILVPFEDKLTEEEINSILSENFPKNKFKFVIDHPFIG